MRFFSAKIVLAGLALATLPAFASTHPHTFHHATVRHSYRHASVRHTSYREHKAIHSHFHPVVSMDSGRATAIQTALIKQGYLSGTPSGVWDSQTSEAMSKLQGDNGWQTRITPDARGLIKLGLGPEAPPANEVVASTN